MSPLNNSRAKGIVVQEKGREAAHIHDLGDVSERKAHDLFVCQSPRWLTDSQKHHSAMRVKFCPTLGRRKSWL